MEIHVTRSTSKITTKLHNVTCRSKHFKVHSGTGHEGSEGEEM